MYDYPLDPSWSIDEITTVIALYNAVEKDYEGEFMNAYRAFTAIVDAKAMQKQLDRAFEKASSYSIYKVFKEAQKGVEWIQL